VRAGGAWRLGLRAVCRIDGERVLDAKTLIGLAHLLNEPVLKYLLVQLVARGRERGAYGRRTSPSQRGDASSR
jgi:hypothetical protein